MSSTASQFVGSIPEHYDRSLGPRIFFGYANDLARRTAALDPASVLELAAGTGILSRRLRDELSSECNLIVSDLNPPMLEVAKGKFQPGELVQFEEVDATDLKFADASLDAVVCQFGVMFFPDKDRSYREVHRILKPGGNYLFNVWDSIIKNPFAKAAQDVLETFFPNNPPGFFSVPFGYHDAAAIKLAVVRAGFENVSVETLPLKSKIPSASDFAKGLVLGNPLQDEIVAREVDPEKVCRAVAEEIDRRLGRAMPLQALVVHASKN